jgi:hypothetical protein
MKLSARADREHETHSQDENALCGPVAAKNPGSSPWLELPTDATTRQPGLDAAAAASVGVAAHTPMTSVLPRISAFTRARIRYDTVSSSLC